MPNGGSFSCLFTFNSLEIMTPETEFLDSIIQDAQQLWKQWMFTHILLSLSRFQHSAFTVDISLDMTH